MMMTAIIIDTTNCFALNSISFCCNVTLVILILPPADAALDLVQTDSGGVCNVRTYVTY